MTYHTMYMAYKGKFKPKHTKKYKGDPTQIIYRSLWERKFMEYCDLTENISQWQSEEFWIPYKNPLDRKMHRYFPDFFIKYTDSNGKKRSVVIEVKPKNNVKLPQRIQREELRHGLMMFKHGLSMRQSGRQQNNTALIESMNLRSCPKTI